MRTRPALLLVVVWRLFAGVAPAAPDQQREILATGRGFEAWEVILNGGGWLDVAYWTGTDASANGSFSGAPSTYVANEETGGYVFACYNDGCISSSVVSPASPASPVDPLFLGGRRIAQMIVTDGPQGCVGSTVTATLNMTPNGPMTSFGRWKLPTDPEIVTVDLFSSLSRGTAVSGSVISCLGTVSVAPGANARFGAIYSAAAAVVSVY